MTTPEPAPRHRFATYAPTNFVSAIETLAFVIAAVVSFVHGNDVLGTALIGASAHGLNHP